MSDNKCNSYPWLRFGASFPFLFLFEKKKGNKTRERKPKNENILSTYNCYVLNASNPTRNMIGALVNAFRRSMIETYNLYRLYIIFFFSPLRSTSTHLAIIIYRRTKLLQTYLFPVSLRIFFRLSSITEEVQYGQVFWTINISFSSIDHNFVIWYFFFIVIRIRFLNDSSSFSIFLPLIKCNQCKIERLIVFFNSLSTYQFDFFYS